MTEGVQTIIYPAANHIGVLGAMFVYGQRAAPRRGAR